MLELQTRDTVLFTLCSWCVVQVDTMYHFESEFVELVLVRFSLNCSRQFECMQYYR